jgi:predicted dehydrogenase
VTLRVAVVGYGLAGRVLHRTLLAAEPRFTVTHVVTGSDERAAQARSDLPGVVVVPTADQLWAYAGDLDLVVLASPNGTHVPYAETAVRLGLATVVDKPLAPTAAEGARVVALAAERGVLLSVFANRRWDSDTLTAADLVRSGTLGEVVRVESRFARYRPEVVPRWKEVPDGAGGVLLDLGPHLVDAALRLLGPPTEVYAEVRAVRPGALVDDDAFVALQHAGGAVSHLWASLVAPVTGPRLVVQGTRGGWVKDAVDGQEDAFKAGVDVPPEPAGRLVTADGVREVPSLPGQWGTYYRGIADALTGGGPVPVPGDDAVAVLRVLDAARESARVREVVRL